MVADEHDGAAVRIPPPLVYLAGLIAGVLLHAFAWPLRIDVGPIVRVGVTVVAIGAGIGLMAAAIGLFGRTGQDPKPWKPTPELISSGIYRVTRNPMYVGMALLQLGIGVGLANGWIVAFVPLVLLVVYVTAIRHEEAYLTRKFGDAYVRYKASVRRWL